MATVNIADLGLGKKRDLSNYANKGNLAYKFSRAKSGRIGAALREYEEAQDKYNNHLENLGYEERGFEPLKSGQVISYVDSRGQEAKVLVVKAFSEDGYQKYKVRTGKGLSTVDARDIEKIKFEKTISVDDNPDIFASGRAKPKPSKINVQEKDNAWQSSSKVRKAKVQEKKAIQKPKAEVPQKSELDTASLNPRKRAEIHKRKYRAMKLGMTNEAYMKSAESVFKKHGMQFTAERKAQLEKILEEYPQISIVEQIPFSSIRNNEDLNPNSHWTQTVTNQISYGVLAVPFIPITLGIKELIGLKGANGDYRIIKHESGQLDGKPVNEVYVQPIVTGKPASAGDWLRAPVNMLVSTVTLPAYALRAIGTLLRIRK